MLLFHKHPSGALEIILMSAIGNGAKNILPQMMCLALGNIRDIYSEDTQLWIDRHNYAALALSEKLFPSGFGVPVYMGSRKER